MQIPLDDVLSSSSDDGMMMLQHHLLVWRTADPLQMGGVKRHGLGVILLKFFTFAFNRWTTEHRTFLSSL